MEELPTYVSVFFLLTTLLTLFIFYRASQSSQSVLILSVVWLAIQSIISLTGFYTITDSLPPRLFLAVLPPVVFILFLFLSSKGKEFISKLNIKTLTLIHLVRIPVELVLFLLFIQQKVPQLMTFEGSNIDILSGVSAPIIYYLVFIKKQWGRIGLICWNFACLALLLVVVSIAIFSAPFPFQQFAFDQPTVAILYFPFIWLPSFVVPIVLLSHLASIQQLKFKK